MTGFPRTGAGDLARLAGAIVGALLRGGDRGEAFARWLDDTVRRKGSRDVVLALGIRNILLVTDPASSAAILDPPPSSDRFTTGGTKRKAMAFLAPDALTVLEDDAWTAMRRFNEAVLTPDGVLPERAVWATRAAFAAPVADIEDVRARMGRVMRAVVLGGGPEDIDRDIRTLFEEIGPKTAIIGSRKTALRDRFKAELARLWRATAPGGETLLARARQAAGGHPEPLLIDQVPHWMFTFTNSGTDLVARSLALIAAHPDWLSELKAEIASADAGSPNGIQDLRKLEASILEAGRLFPPVTVTTHRAARDTAVEGRDVPAGTEVLQHLPCIDRLTTELPDRDTFRPERWLDPADPVHGLRPGTFLSGARSCPGRALYLLVAKTALATQIQAGLPPGSPALARDPLPLAMPKDALRFR